MARSYPTGASVRPHGPGRGEPGRSVLGFLATLAMLAALVLLAVFARNIALSVGVPPRLSGLVAVAVLGVSLYAAAKAAAKKFHA